jgi:hypothetical protein
MDVPGDVMHLAFVVGMTALAATSPYPTTITRLKGGLF